MSENAHFFQIFLTPARPLGSKPVRGWDRNSKKTMAPYELGCRTKLVLLHHLLLLFSRCLCSLSTLYVRLHAAFYFLDPSCFTQSIHRIEGLVLSVYVVKPSQRPKVKPDQTCTLLVFITLNTLNGGKKALGVCVASWGLVLNQRRPRGLPHSDTLLTHMRCCSR